MTEMTKQEFIDMYRDDIVKFHTYYKYTFTYRGVLENGDVITVSVGGGADEIYRFAVDNNDEATVLMLDPFHGEVTRDGAMVASFYDF